MDPEFKNFRASYEKLVPSNPEQFFRDGERIFTDKEKKFLEVLRNENKKNKGMSIGM